MLDALAGALGRGLNVVLQRIGLWTHVLGARQGLKARTRLWRADSRSNRRYATTGRRFLVVRHGVYKPWFYNIILNWVTSQLPEIRPLFELHQLPGRIRNWSSYALHVPWLQDPVQMWSRRAYRQACRLTERCDEYRIPIINRVDKLLNTAKLTGASRIASTGIRTPRMVPVGNVQEFRETLGGLSLPVLVRDNWGHGGPMLRADTMDDVYDLPLERFSRPVAVEFIDTRTDADGLYRKYRYVAAGDEGVAQSMHVQRDWLVRGRKCIFSDDLKDEELAFINNPDANHERLQRARRALELDFVAFDYSYDREGELIVWEANPYPFLHVPKGTRRYRLASLERVLAAIIKLYLQKAGMPVPERVNEILDSPGQRPN